MSTVKLCINCKHFRPVAPEHSGKGYEKCAYSYPGQVNLVEGGAVYQYETLDQSYCQIARKSENATKCGRDGRFFEPARCIMNDVLEGERIFECDHEGRAVRS